MEFRRCERNAELLLSDEWRLASVDEVRTFKDRIINEQVLDSWDIARLLDGWMDGPGYRCNCQKAFRRGMGHMLLVKKPSEGAFDEEKYSGVKLNKEGREAALLLSCDDKITEVMCLVLESIINSFEELDTRQAELDRLTEALDKTFRHRRTVLHYAADQPHNEKHAKHIADLILRHFDYGKEMIKAADKSGRTALHFAALHGFTDLCTFLMDKCGLKADEKDRNGENLLHFVVNSSKRDVIEKVLELSKVRTLIFSQDAKGKTLLHKAAAIGNTHIIGILMEAMRKEEVDSVETNIRQADSFGQTALHEAVSGGHVEAVWYLLACGSKPLLERNSEGKTALHYAVQIPDKKKAKEMAWVLLQHCSSNEERSLLLWASATGIGTAEQCAESSPEVQTYLKQQRDLATRSTKDLLYSAAKLGYGALALELVNRGADKSQIDSSKNGLSTNEQKEVDKFLKVLSREDERVKIMPEEGRDQPTVRDCLGRRAFAEGLAALFLNPYVKSPVTVGISGEWGMGKSSLMLQTETILLQTAAQLAFPTILPFQDFPGAREFKLTQKGKQRYNKMNNGVKALLQATGLDNMGDDPLVYFLDHYQDEFSQVYKSLALMDRCEMFVSENKSTNPSSDLGKVSTILTAHYNAWHYQSELEAWAGLAVTITGALEETMTVSQKIRSRWEYARRKRGAEIWFEFLFPFFLALFLSGWVVFAVWILLSRSKHSELKELTYGSIPVTLVVLFWTVMRQLHSVFKSVSAQVMGYVCLADHTKNLGYQHQVISDIKFLKSQICEKPSLFWKFIAGNWLWRIFGRYRDTVEGTTIPKTAPPSKKDDIRIIVFVDDLDRCQDNIILQVLSAVNLVLAACEINVILGMDKKMISRAIANRYQSQDNNNNLNMVDSADLAEKYLSKIVQLPLALPDDDIIDLLNQQMGVERKEEVVFEQSGDNTTGSQPIDAESDSEVFTDAQAIDLENPQRNLPQSGLESWPTISLLLKCFGVLWWPISLLLKCFRGLWFRPSGRSYSGPNMLGRSKLTSMPISSQLILPTYSKEEQEAITFLSTQVTIGPRIPREWKRFLTYHRLAWNILFRMKQARQLPGGWQSQLPVWIFCCWQWKDNMDLIIKKWKDLMETVYYKDPSLRTIVEHYIHTNVQEDVDKAKWQLLIQTLLTYDVPMESIQSFQKFRLHCEIGYLARPPANVIDTMSSAYAF